MAAYVEEAKEKTKRLHDLVAGRIGDAADRMMSRAAKRMPALAVGNRVRIASSVLWPRVARRLKNPVARKGVRHHFSAEIFTVEGIRNGSDGTPRYLLELEGQDTPRRQAARRAVAGQGYQRATLLKAD